MVSINKKIGIMILTSWLKYDHEIKKSINVMLIYVYNIFIKISIYVNFMLIS